MKIVFLADALDTQKAGIQQYCKGLLGALDALNTNHQLYVVRPNAKHQFKNITEIEIKINQNIPLHQRWRQFTSIPKKLNKIKPCVVMELAHFGPFNLPSSIKRVTFIHDISPVVYPKWHPFSSTIAHRLLLKSILKKTSLILTNSYFSKSEIVRKYPFVENKIKVTHLGCSINLNQLTSKDLLAEILVRKPYFLYVGTLEPRKNILTLIKAFELYQSKHQQNINLVLAGSWGWKYKSIKAAIQQSPSKKDIICTGYISEAQKIQLIKNAKAFIYPSLYEGFGIPVIEAMRLGCPIICSNIDTLKEVAGDKAFYFNRIDALDLCNKMRIVSNLINIDQKKALIRHSEQFTWEETASKTISFIELLK